MDVNPLVEQTSLQEAEIVAVLQNEAAEVSNEDDALEPEQNTAVDDVEPLTITLERPSQEQVDKWVVSNSEPDVVMTTADPTPSPTDNEVIAPVEYEPENIVAIELPPVVPHAHETVELEMLMQEADREPVEAQWEEMLHQPPAELHEDFVRILELRTEQLWPAKNAAEESLQEESVESEAQPVPPIITAITERLAELNEEEKEASTQALRGIVGALHGLEVLESRDADPETIAEVEEQLTELCRQWLESLDIEYTEQDARTIVLILRGSEPPVEISAKNDANITNLGTHEAKYFAQMAVTGSDGEHTIHSVLGTLVLSAVGVHTHAAKAA